MSPAAASMTELYTGGVVILTLIAATLCGISAYLVVLTVAAVFAPRTGPRSDGASRRFAILIPAHNEELLIGRLLDNLAGLDYEQSDYDVHVVADNCTDRTAHLARAAGANVHERFDERERAKGFALRWLLQRIRSGPARYDAYVVLDADSIVAPNFLRALNARLAAGSTVVQTYYSVLNASESPLAGLRYAALAAVHYLRPLGRSLLQLSCGLKGNGMCFSADVLDRFGWDWFTLAEDVEFHLALVSAGVRVDFAPETSVLADMPVTLRQAVSQNERWERGRLQLARRQGFGLLYAGLRRRSPMQVDAAMEQLIPPLSVPFAAGAACLSCAIALGAPFAAVVAGASIVAQVLYLVAALRLARAPWRMYVALAYAPIYIAWKVSVYARSMLAAQTEHWVRTARAAS